MKPLSIAGRQIGPGCPTYVIAEAGSNHDGRLDQALELIDVAADAGADAVKFQTFTADSLYARGAGASAYLGQERSILEILRELEMPLDWLPRLAERCHERRIHLLSTPFSEKAADALEPFVPAFKIASYEMTHHPLVQHCARKGKPMLISTGAADTAEIDRMMAALRATTDLDPVLLQCTASYPAPLDSINLRVMESLRDRYHVLAGLSDHSREALPAPLAAVALGASVIEKHFTLSNSFRGPDHVYAIEPGELRELIKQIRAVERTLGRAEKAPGPVEEELRHFARRSLYATQNISAGERLTRQNSAVLRRGRLQVGLDPERALSAWGRETRRALDQNAAVCEDDLMPLRLERDGVRLRPIEEADAQHIVGWRNLDWVHDQMFAAEKPTLESHLAWFRKMQLRSDRIDFMILWKERPVGTATLAKIDLGCDTAEYGVMLGETDVRGRGVARAASSLALHHAFGNLMLRQLELECFADNAPALALYRRLGFRLALEMPAPMLKNARRREITRMELSRGSWEKGS